MKYEISPLTSHDDHATALGQNTLLITNDTGLRLPCCVSCISLKAGEQVTVDLASDSGKIGGGISTHDARKLINRGHARWLSSNTTYEKIRLLTSSEIFKDLNSTMHHFAAGTLLAVDPELAADTVERRENAVTPEDCAAFIEIHLGKHLVLSGLAEWVEEQIDGNRGN